MLLLPPLDRLRRLEQLERLRESVGRLSKEVIDFLRLNLERLKLSPRSKPEPAKLLITEPRIEARTRRNQAILCPAHKWAPSYLSYVELTELYSSIMFDYY